MKTKMVLRDYLIGYVGGGSVKQNAFIFDKSSGQIIDQFPYLMAKALNDTRFMWQVKIAVLCRRQDGQEYIQSRDIVVEHHYYHHELSDLLNKEHSKLIKETNSEHICNLSWVASTQGETDELLFNRIMMDADAWQHLAKWEIDDNEKLV